VRRSLAFNASQSVSPAYSTKGITYTVISEELILLNINNLANFTRFQPPDLGVRWGSREPRG